jgi:hypothetical protein
VRAAEELGRARARSTAHAKRARAARAAGKSGT